MLPDVLVYLVGALLGIVSVGLLVAPQTRPASLTQAVAVLALALVAGLGTLAFSGLRDDAVEVRGDTIYCQNAEFEDDLPREVEDRCAAQHRDRTHQARVASAGAALLVAGFTCLFTAVGPLSRRAQSETRLPLPARTLEPGQQNLR